MEDIFGEDSVKTIGDFTKCMFEICATFAEDAHLEAAKTAIEDLCEKCKDLLKKEGEKKDLIGEWGEIYGQIEYKDWYRGGSFTMNWGVGKLSVSYSEVSNMDEEKAELWNAKIQPIFKSYLQNEVE